MVFTRPGEDYWWFSKIQSTDKLLKSVGTTMAGEDDSVGIGGVGCGLDYVSCFLPIKKIDLNLLNLIILCSQKIEHTQITVLFLPLA